MTIENNWCVLRIDDNSMMAFLGLKAPTGDEVCAITPELIVEFLNSHGIVYGINEAAIHSISECAQYGQYICAAAGKAPTKGADGYFKYEMSTEDMKKKPLITEDGTADYKNSLKLAIIHKDELLATYIPPEMGEDGTDIYGNFLLNLGPGKNLMPLRGKGIVADEEKTHFYAEYSGHIVMDGDRVTIEKLFTVSGNLGIEVGNVNFDGDVEVTGDVRSGMEINATGAIFIHGHVGACKITAGENITIDKGTQGHGNALILSKKGDVACKFVEWCTIKAAGSIYADSVLNSILIAKEKVVVSSKYGNVVGGEIYGMRGVIVKEAGNDAGTSTLLRAGLPREEFIRSKELSKMIGEKTAKVEEFTTHLEKIEKLRPEELNPRIVATKTKIIRARIVLTSDIKKHTDELAIIEARIQENPANTFVNVTGTIFEGVRIYLGSHPYLVNEAVKEVAYRLVGENVICDALEDNNKK